jgi:TRAP-type C4-dicarboxylate transport system permease large subunit
VLVLLGDQLNNSFQAAQLAKGIFAPDSISVSDLFAASIVPGLTLVALYILFLVAVAVLRPAAMPPIPLDPAAPKGLALARQLAKALLAPALLIVVVLGSILIGLVTPTEAAAVGAVGAILLAALRVEGAMRWPVALSIVAFAALMALRAAFDIRVGHGFAFGVVIAVVLMLALAGGLALAQLCALAVLWFVPGLATWLPRMLYGG